MTDVCVPLGVAGDRQVLAQVLREARGQALRVHVAAREGPEDGDGDAWQDQVGDELRGAQEGGEDSESVMSRHVMHMAR